MKPILLTVTAFGPYASRQIFDFRQLRDRSLFLISGPTGAGKTTVLDAICFALYGETSGKERDASQMRSHHSAPGLATEVFFDFALGADTYRVWRRPQQDLVKKRGSGITKGGSQAALWKRTGLTDDTAEGEPLASKSGDVTAKVEQILGFRADQFRQVVVLPQGKFRDLLLADSHQRQAILETLFQTEWYRRIEERLKNDSRELNNQLQQLKIGRQKVLELAGVQNDNELKQRLISLEEQARGTAEQIERYRRTKAAAELAWQAGRDALRKLVECEAASGEVGRLVGRKAEMDALQERMDRAGKALGLQDLESQHSIRLSELETARRALTQATEELNKVEGRRDKARRDWEFQQQRKPEADGFRKEFDRLEGLVERVGNLAQAKEQLAEAWKKAEELGKDLARAKRALADLEKKTEEAKLALSSAEKLAVQSEGRRMALAQAENDLQGRRNLDEMVGRQQKLALQHQQASEALQALQKEIGAAVEKIRTMEAALQDGFAGYLAQKLIAGEPCPVCGSREHPGPAHLSVEVPDPKDLDGLRERIKILDDQQKNAGRSEVDIQTKLAVVKSQAEELRSRLGDKARSELEPLKALMELRSRELIEAQEVGKRVPGLQKGLEGLVVQKMAAISNVEKLQKETQEEEIIFQALQAALKEREADIPDPYRQPEKLRNAMDGLKKRLQKLTEEGEASEAALKKALEDAAACKASADAGRKRAEETRRAAEEQARIFTERLLAAGFRNEADYKDSKLPEELASLFKQEIDQYRQSVASAKGRLDLARSAAENLATPDMALLEAALGTAQSALEEALRRDADLKSKLAQVKGWQDDLARTAEGMAALEKTYQIIGYLSAVSGGENAQKITYERFVLGFLLDDVLGAATQRLKIMSKGRYQLQRQRSPQDLRRPGGLDLEVYDAYTGTSRPAGTLSGGESFLAALSLALGLADAVQSYTGGVYLDTIFVDEGFGSLDSEALDAALQALIDLQKGGRLVGIISHVPELKEHIGARLEIRAGKTGSTAAFLVD